MLPLALSLSIWIAFAPPDAAPSAGAELSTTIEAVLSEPNSTTISELEQQIAALEAKPQDVIADPALADELLRARVVLAWAQTEPELAAAAMDEAIRSAAGRELPLKGLGTDLKTLAKQRADALANAGTVIIEVDCAVACQVIVNERRALNPTDPLPLGTYRIAVVARGGEVESMREDVVLDVAGETARLEFGRAAKDEAVPVVVDAPTKQGMRKRGERKEKPTKPDEPAKSATSKRLMPLWAELVGIVAGVGLVGAGATLLALDGKCKGGGAPSTCPILIENTVRGAAIVAVGAGAMLSFGMVLGVDQARVGRERGRGAMLSWSLRF